MLTVVTGAAGFVGRALVSRMDAVGVPGRVRLVDRVAPHAPSARFEPVAADLADRAALAAALDGAECVIHLAALPGGAAEADPAASRRINLDATLDLIDLLAARSVPVRLVYASSIAALGDALPDPVDDGTPPRPAMTYGAHKFMIEVALADAVRRGVVDGIALRLPGIVARPAAPSGLKSAFMSEVFHAIREARRCIVPVGPDATMWLLSARAAADALLHAAAVPRVPAACVLTLPALRVQMSALVATVARGAGREADVVYAPDPATEAHFGRLPHLLTPAADGLGFVHDGDLGTLVTNTLGGLAGG